MPGIGSFADCPCGFRTHVNHGALDGKDFPLLVVVYTAEGNNLASMERRKAEAQGLEIIPPHPQGGGYRCPRCGAYSLTFEDSGLHWD